MRNDFHFKTFYNFLKRNQMYTAINVFGFAVSLMFVILIGLYIVGEMGVDKFHRDRDRTFRLVHREDCRWAPAVARDLSGRFPEIEQTLRMLERSFIVDDRQGGFVASDGWMADTTFFSFFNCSFLEIDPAGAFPDSNSVVLTESFARQLFPEEGAVGTRILVDNLYEFTVSGVVADFKNSHLRNPSMIVPFENMGKFWDEDFLYSFGQINTLLYLKLHEGVDQYSLEDHLDDYLKASGNYWQFNQRMTGNPRLEPLDQVYYSDFYPGELLRANDRIFLSVMIVTVIVILFFAVINYINLSVAQSTFRVKEAAIRRLVGGSRLRVYNGFVMESVVLCLICLVIGIGLANQFHAWFERSLTAEVRLAEAISWQAVVFALVGIVLLGLAAGSVPAYLISRTQPIEIVKGRFRRQFNMSYSRWLITFQYFIAIILIGCTITIHRQGRYMRSDTLGYDPSHLIVCSYQGHSDQVEILRENIKSVNGVRQVAFTVGYPGENGLKTVFADDHGVPHIITTFCGDSVFLQLMNFGILHQTGNRHPGGAWLNEMAWERLGISEDSSYYSCQEWSFPIKGKLRNFHFTDFTHPIEAAMVHELEPDQRPTHILIKIGKKNPVAVLERVGKVYDKMAGGQLFDGKFMDDKIDQMYQNQNRLSRMLRSFTLVAAIIVAMGILAMSTYFIRQRAREIAVRKAYGSDSREVFVLLVSHYLKLVLIAFVFAVPVIWYLMTKWLTGFAYRIPLGPDIFIWSGVVIFLLAGATLLRQSWKAARANPVETLRG